MQEIYLITHGMVDNNPGKGAYGIILKQGNYEKILSKGFLKTTKNRMDLTSVIDGLEAIKNASKVIIAVDSNHVKQAVENGWLEKWQSNNWMRTRQNKVLNSDLWQKLHKLLQIHEISFIKINLNKTNKYVSKCINTAKKTIESTNLEKDEGYFTTIEDKKKLSKPGDLCKKCGSPVIKKDRTKGIKSKQKYYFARTLYCPNCDFHYYTESAKKTIGNKENQLFIIQKETINKEGDLCKHCKKPVSKRFSQENERKKGQKYYYERYLYCEHCGRMYMAENGKRFI